MEKVNTLTRQSEKALCAIWLSFVKIKDKYMQEFEK